MNTSEPHIPAAGSLLLSEPFMFDENFRRAVVLLCESNEEGAFGLIVNKPMGISLSRVMAKPFQNFDAPLFYGGPVEPNTLHFVHNLSHLIPESIKIAPGLYRGGDFKTLSSKIDAGEIPLENIRFLLGYSGWDSEQLQSEIAENAWIIARRHAPALLKEKPHRLWKNILKDMGGKYSMMAEYPMDPLLN